jgi:cytochrome c-type biogenesis protein CcmH/NrfG
VAIGLADIHLKREDPERAANCARRALAINPDYVDAWLILAHECIMHHDMEGAQRATDTAHKLDPYSTLVVKTLEEINSELAKKRAD